MPGHIAVLKSPINLNAKRFMLLLLIVLQTFILILFLSYQYQYIEGNAVRILKNTTILEAKQFENSLDAMRYQMRVIGNAILLNHTISPEHAPEFLKQELKRDWLDAVVVFDARGDFIASDTPFPLEHALSGVTVASASFGSRPLFNEMIRSEVNERLFYWQSNGTDPNLRGFVMYRAVRAPDGKYLGGSVGFFSLDTMAQVFMQRHMINLGLDLGPGGTMAVLDRVNATTLFRVNAGIVSGFHYSSKLRDFMALSSDTPAVIRYVSPVDDVERIGMFLNLAESKWVLVVGLAKNDVLHGWYFQVLWSVTGLIIIAVIEWLLLHYMHANTLQRRKYALEARRDPLTDLFNRRYFDEWISRARFLARRHDQTICLLSLDVDNFKKINDIYGHDGGDAVLRRVGHLLPEMIRPTDTAIRFGGEEFMVALSQADVLTASAVAERIRVRFENEIVKFGNQSIRFTASFGIAQMTLEELSNHDGVQATLFRADKALYCAKSEGRNCYRIAD